MFATEELRQEHKTILVMLEVLEARAIALSQGRAANLPELARILDFLRTFADACHHGKEEELLFPALVDVGMPSHGGPIEVMLDEHTHGRDFVRVMGESLPRLSEDDTARQQFIQAAMGYATLLRAHIGKENNVLFAFAERYLSPAVHACLKEQFSVMARERIGEGAHARYQELPHALRAPGKTLSAGC